METIKGNSMRIGRAYLAVILIIVILAAGLIFVGVRKYLVTRNLKLVNQDMEQIAKAIDGWYITWSMYPVPDEVFIPETIYSLRYATEPLKKIDPEVINLLNQLPRHKCWQYVYSLGRDKSQLTDSEQALCPRIEKVIDPLGDRLNWGTYSDLLRSRLYYYQSLTSPLPYLSSITIPPFLKIKPKDRFNSDDPGYYRYGTIVEKGQSISYYSWVLLSNGPDGDIDIKPELLEINATGELVIHDRYPFTGQLQRFWNLVYDPTNGLTSNGDIITWSANRLIK